MNIYWSFLILSLFICYWYAGSFRLVDVGDHLEKRGKKIQGWVFFAPIIFFTGFRSYVGDTATYIATFQYVYPDNLQLLDFENLKDAGFVILSVLYKQFISTNYVGWLLIISVISCVATMKGFLHYSEDFGMTCFLFIATTTFTYLLNGMRQYICIAILFACTYMVLQRRYIAFSLLVLLLSTIHQSAIIFLLVIPMVNSKPWSVRMTLVTLAGIIFALGFDTLFPAVSTVLENTQYEGYVDYINTSGVGSNIIRLFIAIIPVWMAFYGRKIVEREADRFIKLSVNMSVINMCVYMVATVSSGMAVGRVAAYFDIYNLVLLPWLINHVFKGSTRAMVKTACFGVYIVYFWFQMVVTWHISYGSDFLGIQYRWY